LTYFPIKNATIILRPEKKVYLSKDCQKACTEPKSAVRHFHLYNYLHGPFGWLGSAQLDRYDLTTRAGCTRVGSN